MKAHKIEHTSQGVRPKVSNSLLGVISIFAIFLLVWFAFKNVSMTNQEDLSGGADSVISQAPDAVVSEALYEMQYTESQNKAICKIIVGQTTIYDETTLAASLKVGVSTYYAGNPIAVQEINADGCLLNIDGNSEYIAVGQIQRVGTVYVTVKEVIMS